MRIGVILLYLILSSSFLLCSSFQHHYSFWVRNFPELVFYPHSLFAKVLYSFNSVLTVLPPRKKTKQHCSKHTTHLCPSVYYSLDLCHLPTGMLGKDWRAESPQTTFVTSGGPCTIQPTQKNEWVMVYSRRWGGWNDCSPYTDINLNTLIFVNMLLWLTVEYKDFFFFFFLPCSEKNYIRAWWNKSCFLGDMGIWAVLCCTPGSLLWHKLGPKRNRARWH